MAVLTLVKVLLALVPRVVMAVMHSTIIRASMTAYSTAVGPSSRFRKFTRPVVSLLIIFRSPCAVARGRSVVKLETNVVVRPQEPRQDPEVSRAVLRESLFKLAFVLLPTAL